MATAIYSATASLDGFIAGPGGDMSLLTRFFGEDDDNQAARRLMEGVGSLLVGNRSFGGDDPNKGTDRRCLRG